MREFVTVGVHLGAVWKVQLLTQLSSQNGKERSACVCVSV